MAEYVNICAQSELPQSGLVSSFPWQAVRCALPTLTARFVCSMVPVRMKADHSARARSRTGEWYVHGMPMPLTCTRARQRAIQESKRKSLRQRSRAANSA